MPDINSGNNLSGHSVLAELLSSALLASAGGGLDEHPLFSTLRELRRHDKDTLPGASVVAILDNLPNRSDDEPMLEADDEDEVGLVRLAHERFDQSKKDGDLVGASTAGIVGGAVRSTLNAAADVLDIRDEVLRVLTKHAPGTLEAKVAQTLLDAQTAVRNALYELKDAVVKEVNDRHDAEEEAEREEQARRAEELEQRRSRDERDSALAQANEFSRQAAELRAKAEKSDDEARRLRDRFTDTDVEAKKAGALVR